LSHRIKSGIYGAIFGLIVSGHLLLIMPFTLYQGNYQELNSLFTEIVFEFQPILILVVGTTSLIALLLPKAASSRFICVLAIISMLLWLQGNLLVWEYGQLDGRKLEWNLSDFRGWADSAIWIGAILFSIVFYRKFGKKIITLSVVLFCLQCGLLFAQLVTFEPKEIPAPGRTNLAAAEQNIPRFSAKHNIVHIIADGFQSDIFADLLSDGKFGMNTRAIMDGFTYFRQNMGVFPYTHMSIPAIVTGQIYRNQLPIQEFIDTAISQESIFGAAVENGYEVDMAVPDGWLPKLYARAPHQHILPLSGIRHMTQRDFARIDALKLLDLTFFRMSPHFLKKHIYNDQHWFAQSILLDKKFQSLEFFAHTTFLRELLKNMTADRDQPVYKLIHVMLSHKPMVTNTQCKYAGRILVTARQTVHTQSRCGLIEILKIFNRMKELGIYDTATIILMGDHGAWVEPPQLIGMPNQDGTAEELINPRLTALAVPLLAIKRPGDSGPIRIDDSPSWTLDTATTISKISGWDSEFPGRSVFDLNPSDIRPRNLLYYRARKSDHNNDYLEPIEEFVINGNVYDSNNWQHAKTYYPNNETKVPSEKSEVWITRALK
jgi:hypothetical protein